jgi:hypothetical protein
MGDELVNDVLDSLKDIAFANGLNLESLRPVVDSIVNRLRPWLNDDLIRVALIGFLVQQGTTP